MPCLEVSLIYNFTLSMKYSLCPKLLECFDGNIKNKDFLRTLQNAQLGFDLDLNQLSNELFYPRKRATGKKI
jgi:hypothetical protein